MNKWKCYVILGFALIPIITGLLLEPVLPVQAGSDLPERATPTTVLSDKEEQKDKSDRPAGAYIELQVAQNVPVEAWAVVQWQDNAGGWHDVEGWSGTLDESGRQRWWVAAKDFNTGPFRWIILKEKGGEMVENSQPFTLPAQPDEARVVMILSGR